MKRGSFLVISIDTNTRLAKEFADSNVVCGLLATLSNMEGFCFCVFFFAFLFCKLN